ncbi:MAG: hypothetical protein MJ252_02540 [archaeon]|nr:hypothetical protein [archaeon]
MSYIEEEKKTHYNMTSVSNCSKDSSFLYNLTLQNTNTNLSTLSKGNKSKAVTESNIKKKKKIIIDASKKKNEEEKIKEYLTNLRLNIGVPAKDIITNFKSMNRKLKLKDPFKLQDSDKLRNEEVIQENAQAEEDQIDNDIFLTFKIWAKENERELIEGKNIYENLELNLDYSSDDEMEEFRGKVQRKKSKKRTTHITNFNDFEEYNNSGHNTNRNEETPAITPREKEKEVQFADEPKKLTMKPTIVERKSSFSQRKTHLIRKKTKRITEVKFNLKKRNRNR